MLLPRRIGDDFAGALTRPAYPGPARPGPRPGRRPGADPGTRPAHRPVPWTRAVRPWVAGAAVWLCAVGICLAYVQRQAEAARLGIQMSDEKQEIQRLQGENQQLTARVRELRSLARIGRLAMAPVQQGGLGMVSPRNLQVAVLDPDALAPEPPQLAAAPPAGPAPGLWQQVRDFLGALWPGQPIAARAAP